MKTLLGLVALASSTFVILTSGSPAAAQYYPNPYVNRSGNSFSPSQSNIRYRIQQPQRSYGSDYGSSFGQPKRSNRGFGHSSGSYFGW